MVVIYTQDETIIRDNADAAKADLISAYGDKLGVEAYKVVDKAPNGTSFRKNGGPLIQVVDKEKAEWIRAKETSIGMMA